MPTLDVCIDRGHAQRHDSPVRRSWVYPAGTGSPAPPVCPCMCEAPIQAVPPIKRPLVQTWLHPLSVRPSPSVTTFSSVGLASAPAPHARPALALDDFRDEALSILIQNTPL